MSRHAAVSAAKALLCFLGLRSAGWLFFLPLSGRANERRTQPGETYANVLPSRSGRCGRFRPTCGCYETYGVPSTLPSRRRPSEPHLRKSS